MLLFLTLVDGLQVWDFSSHLNSLGESDATTVNGGSAMLNQAPLVKFGGHKDEGFAIDWSPLVPGRLVSGTSRLRFVYY